MKQTNVNYAIWILGSAIQDLTHVNDEMGQEWRLSAIESIKKALQTIQYDELCE